MKRKHAGTSTPQRTTGSRSTTLAQLKNENAALKARLEEMRETLYAIKTGEVDALFMDGRVYSLQGAETPYRILVESMNEGAATLSSEGIILYCNERFGTLLGNSLKTLIGSPLRQYVQESDWPVFDQLVADGRTGLTKGECTFQTRKGAPKTIQCSFSPFAADGTRALCLVATDLTDRKQAENARFANMLASIGDAVVAANAHGMIEFLNDVAEKLMGWTRAEANMRPAPDVFAVIHEKTRAPLDCPIRRVLQTGKPTRLADHALLIRKDGREIPIDDSAAPILGPNGKMMGVVLVFRDVTEQREKERAFRENQALLHAVTTGVADAIYMKDSQSRLLMVNPATVELVGKPREEILGRTDAEFFDDPAVGAAILENDRRILETGKPQVFEEIVLTPQGYRSMLSSKTPWRDLDGKIIGVLGVSRDITERKRAEEQLQQSNQRINDILSSIQDDFYVLDRDWKFVFASNSFTLRTGKEPGDFVGRIIWEMFPNHLGTAFEENLRAAMEKREIRRFEIPGRYTNAWYRMAAYPSPDGITVLGSDITERKRMEQELSQSESEYRLLFEFNPQPMWMVDQKTSQFLAVNEAALAQYGYTKEEFLSLRLFDIVHADHHAEILRWHGYPSASLTHPTVQTHIRKNRSMIKVEVIVRDTKLEGQSVRLMQGQDVTRRLQAEEALRENLDLFQAFVESSQEASLMTDERGIILAASRPGISLLCSTHEELIGQNVLRYIPSEQLPILEKSYDTLLKEPLRPRIAMVRIRLLDGTSIWVEAVCSMLRVDDRIGGFIVGLKRIEVGVMSTV